MLRSATGNPFYYCNWNPDVRRYFLTREQNTEYLMFDFLIYRFEHNTALKDNLFRSDGSGFGSEKCCWNGNQIPHFEFSSITRLRRQIGCFRSNKCFVQLDFEIGIRTLFTT
jgi:hypothetical protein